MCPYPDKNPRKCCRDKGCFVGIRVCRDKGTPTVIDKKSVDKKVDVLGQGGGYVVIFAHNEMPIEKSCTK